MATYFAKSSVTISPVLIGHVERLYSMATMASDVMVQEGGLQNAAAGPHIEAPHQTDLAIPAYILAVSAVEAFVNEMFLSPSGEWHSVFHPLKPVS